MTEQLYQQAVEHHQAGRLSQAEALYRRILRENPAHARAWNLLGILAIQARQFGAAVDLIRKAIAIDGATAEYHNNLANALRCAGHLEAAVAAYQKAASLNPEIREIQTNLADTSFSLGLALAERKQFARAVGAYRTAIQAMPDFPEAYNNLGNALLQIGQIKEAASAYRRAIELKPDYAVAHGNLGHVLERVGQTDEAITILKRAIELQPDFAPAHNNLANAYREKAMIDEAGTELEAALRYQPDMPQAWSNLGSLRKDQGCLDDAIDCLRRSLKLDPTCVGADSNLLYLLQFHANFDAGKMRQEHRRWNRLHAEPLKRHILPHENDRDPDRPLRVGYVGADFRDHCLSFFTLPLLENLDRAQVLSYCYANVANPDQVTSRHQSVAHQWRDILGMTDEQAARQIREDRIDILVDVPLHMSGGRPLIFARKPAPIQLSWLGYPAGSGLEAMDGRISDPYLDPPGMQNGDDWQEPPVRLPDCFWCYDPLGEPPEVNALPAANGGPVTFGCLNNFCKVNDIALKLWAKVLSAVPDSRLVILCDSESSRQRTLDSLGKFGLASSRVEFVGRRLRLEYLKLYHGIDIALDTFPYNGHTTSMDSFWMGVPVVSLVGRTPVARAGLSVATNIGLPEWVVESEEEFVKLAVDWTTNRSKLAELRASLRPRMKASPLMNAPRFARNMESAFRTIWQRWCKGVEPCPR